MAYHRHRAFFAFLSLALFLITALLSAKLSAGAVNPPENNTLTLILCALNTAIILSWIAAGPAGGVIITVLSLGMALWAVFRSGIHWHHMLTISFLATNVVGYLYSSSENKLTQSYNLKLEKQDEEMNVVANSIKETTASIRSFEEKLERYSVLKGVVEEFSTVLALEDINRLIIEKASSVVAKPGRVLLFLTDIEKQELMLSALKGEVKTKAKKGDVFDKWVMRHRKPLIIEDITRDFRFAADDIHEAKKYFNSLIACPLVSEDKVIGVLRMDSPEGLLYAQDDLRFLGIISDLAAISVQNAALYSRTQELAIKDGLTGIFVRRYFMERFQSEIIRADLSKNTFSLVIFDIDHFKEYNDKYGHMAGDLVLKHLTRIMSSMIREVDILARYGGEEMVLLLVGMDKKSALEEAEMIRNTIEEKPLMLRRRESLVTVSAGIASYPKDAVSDEGLIKIADERLYKAKAEGRNKVCAD